MKTAYNPDTGDTLVLVGDEWVKPEKVAKNEAGDSAYLIGDQWFTKDQEIPQQVEEPSALKVAAHGAMRGALPAVAGIVGGAAATPLGAPAGPVGMFGTGMAGGFAAASATAAAQEEFLKAHPELAKTLGLDEETRLKEEKAHPYASMAGEIAPNLLAFRPTLAPFRRAAGLAEEQAARVIAERNAALTNAGLNTAVGAGMEIGQQAMGEEPIDYGRVGIASLGGALGMKETRLGRGLTRVGEMPYSEKTRSLLDELRRPEFAEEPTKAPAEAAQETVEPPTPKSATQDYEAMMASVEGKPVEQVQQVAPKFETKTRPDMGFSSDIPNEDWLKSKRDISNEYGTKPSGAPKVYGSVTGTYDRTVMMPVDVLAKIKGVNNEQANVRKDDLASLKDVMGKTGRLPQIDGRDYAPFITVDQNGVPHVSEGNHRIMAAKELGFDYIPVDIRYFNGGEREDGILHPSKVDAYDAQAHEQGKTAETYHPEGFEPTKAEVGAQTTEAPQANMDDLYKRWREELDQMGLKNVGLNLEESLKDYVNGRMKPINGKYFDSMIHVSMQSENPYGSLGHESLHAMKDHGFFNDRDWSLLSSKAQSEWMKKYKIAKDYGHLPLNEQHEEAIAKAFADYKSQAPKVKGIMDKAIDALKRVGNVLRGKGFQTTEDVFRKAAEGKFKPTEAPTAGGAKFEVPKKQATAKNVLGETVKSNWDVEPNTWLQEHLVRRIQDKHIDLKRTVEAIKKHYGNIDEKFNPYLKDGLYHSKAANEFRIFNEKSLDPLAKKINKFKLTTKEVDDYLHNRHAEERNKQMNKINPDIVDEFGNAHPYPLKDRASGIHTEDAKKYLASLPKEKRAALESVSKDIDNMIKGTQELLVKSGQIKQEDVDAWNRTYKSYVPLMRDMEEEFMNSFGRGMGMKNIFGKRAMGSEREVTDILNSIIRQREVAIENAAKMEVDHALYRLAIKAPNPDIWLPVSPKAIKNPELLARELDALGLDGKDIVGMMMERQTRTVVKDPVTGLDKVVYKTNPLERYKDNVLPIRINGEDSYIFFNKQNPVAANMVKAFRGMDTPTVGLVGQQIGKGTQWLAKVNTQWNPVFGGLNFMRDFGSAMANLSSTELRGQQKAIAKNVGESFSTIWKTMRAERNGEPLPNTEFGKLYQEFREHGGQTLYREQLSRRADQENIINEKIKQLNSNAAKKAASSFFNHLSDFNDSVENAIRLSAYKAAKDKGMSAEKAATLAKELTVNFDRKGANSQAINNYFAFFNASMQGTARMVQTLKGPAGKKIMLGGVGLGMLQAGMMAMAGFDDNDPPEFVKSRNFIIPTPDGKYFAIPYPLGLHFLPNMGRLAVEAGIHGDVTKHAAKMAGVIADSFNPLGGGDLSLQTITPTVLDPAVAIATNRDAFGRPISKEDRATAPTTGLSRSREQSTAINKAVAEAINYITGGTEDVKGLLSPTADQLDYLVGQVTGGVGREAMKVAQTAKAVATGETEDLASYQIPVLGRFYGDTQSPAANSQHFYDNVTRMAEHEATIKGMRERHENVAEYLRDNPEARMWQQANNIENQISAINKQKKQWIKAERPEEQIKMLDDRKQALMQRFNDRIRELKE
jgi:hypothetical protein